jgi:hypothetical protein
MTTRRRTTHPVPMSPVHRRSWRSLWRRCSCGLKEPCIDRRTASVLYLPTEEPPPPPPPPPPSVPPRHPEGPMVHGGLRAPVPHGATGPHFGPAPGAEYAPVYLLDRTARAPDSARMRRAVSARVPVPQPGRAGSLTPAQALRADHAERRQNVPDLRAAIPGSAYGSAPHQSPPHHPSPARHRPGPARDWTYDGQRAGDSKS